MIYRFLFACLLTSLLTGCYSNGYNSSYIISETEEVAEIKRDAAIP